MFIVRILMIVAGVYCLTYANTVLEYVLASIMILAAIFGKRKEK